MATAWYKPHAIPKLLRAFPGSSGASIEVWNTTCIVRNFGKHKPSNCSILINPSNPQLTGVHKFDYFPRGGPEPTEPPRKDPHHIMAYVSQWGGMELKEGMLFSSNVVDGLVHELGGWPLRIQCMMKDEVPVGQAVSTGPGGRKLRQEYNLIVHTVPPFYKYHEDPERYLAECYRNSLQLAFAKAASGTTHRVACPLLGAGGRGFPLDMAIRIAATESVGWRDNEGCKNQALAFGIPDEAIARTLIAAIQLQQETVGRSETLDDAA